jgi:ribosomal protein S18
MPAQLDTLIHYVSQLKDLDMVQDWIANARDATPTNLRVQHSLHHRQVELDIKRARIEVEMLEIASRN